MSEEIKHDKATLQTADTVEELESATKIPVENVEITQEEALAQLPKEVQGAIGHIIKIKGGPMSGKFVVRLPDFVIKQGGREFRAERFISNNGGSMRLFHTKKQAEDMLAYYQELMIKQATLREQLEQDKIALGEE